MLNQREKRQSTRVITALLIFGFFAGLAFSPACNHAVSHDAFAKCLTTKQVTMYGLYWCEHCADQKKLFGPSFQYVSYVECGIEGSRAEQPVCIQAGAKNFPTWKLPDGSMVEGVQTLQTLSEKSGCSLQ